MLVTAMSFHVEDGVHVLVVLTIVEIGQQLPCANIYGECSVLMCTLFTFLCSASCVPIVYYLVVFCLGKTPQVIHVGLMCLTKWVSEDAVTSLDF